MKERDLAVDKIIKTWQTIEKTRLLAPFLIFGPFVGILLFNTLVSNKYGNVVSFAIWFLSVVMIVVSLWMLVWILK